MRLAALALTTALVVMMACGDDAKTNASPASTPAPSLDAGTSSSSSSGSSSTVTADAGDPNIPLSACGKPKPGPTNTGVPAGTTLKPSKTIRVETNGAVIEDLDVDGEIEVYADNVTIRRVKITSGSYYPVRFDDPHTGLVIEDSEIIGTSDDVTSAVSFAHYTARRLNVHGSADGFKADADVLIEDSWIHDLRNGPDQHNDGMQSTGGKGVTLRNNNISGASNACVQTGDEGNVPTEDLLIECNWLDGGGYTLNIRGTGATRPKNTKIVNNRFGRHSAYGPWTLDDPSPTVTGNVWDDDNSPMTYEP
jgi:hypothetical protein